MLTQQDVIKKFVESLDKTNLRGTAAVDEAVRACSSFKSYSDLMEHFLADRNNASSGDDFLKRYCGINLDNTDTGAITGADAGGKTVKTAESIVLESGSSTSVYPPSNSFSYKGLTVNVPNASTLNDSQKNIIAGLYTWWLKGGLDLIEQTYGISYSDNDTTCKTINVDFDMGSNSNLAYVWSWETSVTTIHINSSLYQNLKNSDENGTGDITSTTNLDRIIAYGLARPLMCAKINYEESLPSAVGKGISVLIDGYDDKGKNEITDLVDDKTKLQRYSTSNSNLDSGIRNDDKYDFAMGYMLLRYLAKQETDPTNVGDITIPIDALEYNGHSYYLYSGVASTWEEAQEYCMSLGGHLAVINDSAENTALFNYMKTKGYSSAYFGLSDTATEGNWQWVDDSPVTYTNWETGEPSNGNNADKPENYAMFYWKFNNGKWNDGDFTYSGTDNGGKVFICEWDTVRQDNDIEIDEATALEVIKLFKGMEATEKKATLKENLATLESLKTIVEGDKKIEIFDEETGKTFYADGNNLFDCINAYYDKDAAPIITEYTNYMHDSNGRIVYKRKYKRDSAGNIVRDANNQPIREFELDANGNKIKIENNSEHREFMGNMLGSISDISEIFDSIKSLSDDNLNGIERTAEITKLNGSIISLTGNIRSLGNFDKAGTIAPIASSVLGLIGSTISLFDGVKAEEVVNVVQKSLESTVIFSKYVLNPEFANTKIGQLLGGQNFVDKVQPFAEKLNANALKINLGVAIVLGLVTGGVQYFKSNEQYQIDGLKDSQAIKDKWTDAFTAGMKTFYGTVTGGLDEAVYGILSSTATNLVYLGEWFGTLITGGDVSKVKKMSTYDKNYMELFGDFVKLAFLNQYTDPQGDKDGYMENTKVGRNIYSGGGNDRINNKASKANIYSGTGNDVIFCSEGTNQQYIDGGNDNDHIALYGSSNEIHGGLGDDQIDIFGDSKNPASGNYILGEAGNDYIWIGDGKSKKISSTANSIDGGAGDDVIFIDQTKTPNIIFYNNGDGNDEIFGYDSNDKICINKSDYTTKIDGDDVKIIIGNGSMILYDAKDKKLNITRTDIDIMPTGMTADKNKTTLTISNKFKAQNIYLENYDKSFTKVNASGLAKTQSIEIKGNSSSNLLKGGKGDDTINGSTGNNTLTGGAGNDVFIYAGGNDIITDYKAGEDKISLNVANITKSSVKGSDVVLTTAKGTVSIKGAKDKIVTFNDGTEKIFFADTSYSPLVTGLTYDTKRTVLTASSKFTGNEIDLNNYLSTVTKINASALSKNISIVGTANNNSIKGGKGGDTIYGGKGNDTLTGGTGADVFIYSNGNDIITDYKPGEDKIKIGTITKSTLKGSDVILTTANGTLTVKSAKDKAITLIDSSGKTTEKIFYADTSYSPLVTGLTYDTKRTVLTASSKFTDNEIDLNNYLSTVTKLNASAVSQSLTINGNSSANSLKGGKGADVINGNAGNDTIIAGNGNDILYGDTGNDSLKGENGNDTLYGGLGNDIFTGGSGNDLFVYEGGNDTITDYTAGQDKIKLSSGTITNTTYNKKDVIFTIGIGTLTVKNAKGKKISVTDSSNKTQTYSKTLDLLYDNNFVTDEFQLDDVSEITETNYSVEQIHYSINYQNLENDSITSAITFEKK